MRSVVQKTILALLLFFFSAVANAQEKNPNVDPKKVTEMPRLFRREVHSEGTPQERITCAQIKGEKIVPSTYIISGTLSSLLFKAVEIADCLKKVKLATYEPYTPPTEAVNDEDEKDTVAIVASVSDLICTSYERPPPNAKTEYQVAYAQGRKLTMGEVRECFSVIEQAKLVKKQAQEREKNKPLPKGMHKT